MSVSLNDRISGFEQLKAVVILNIFEGIPRVNRNDAHSPFVFCKVHDAIESKFGMVPNIFKGMANSPVALAAYLKLDEMIAGGNFTPVEQNVVRLVVSQYNGCEYCVAAHTMGLGANGLGKDDIVNIRKGQSENPKLVVLITFTNKVLETKGFVSEGHLESLKSAGYTDTHAVVLNVIIAQKTLSNLFNHINQTDLDLPAAPEI